MTAIAGRAGSRWSSLSRPRHPYRRLLTRGLLATAVGMAAVMATAAVMKSLGVEFEIPSGGEEIPVAGFGSVTAFFSVVGIAIASALRRWSADPARRFLQTAAALVAVSFVPPLFSGAAAATIVCLVVLHLVVASVMVPALTRALGSRF